MKRQGDALDWPDVSLYTNPFNEVISEAAFDGTISETDFSSTSPEFGTDGYYAKCWVREESGIKLYKSGSAFLEIEPLSEFLASQLAEVICWQAVQYDLDYYHGKLISKCSLFTNEEVGLAKASACSTELSIPSPIFSAISGDWERGRLPADVCIRRYHPESGPALWEFWRSVRHRHHGNPRDGTGI